MYLAMGLIYLALAVVLDSGVAVVSLAPLLLVIQQAVILREERYLERKFGKHYLQYKRSVRRWLQKPTETLRRDSVGGYQNTDPI